MDTPTLENSVTIGMIFGCLQVLDEGSEYIQVMDEKIANIQEEKDRFIKDAEAGRYDQEGVAFCNRNGKMETIPCYKYKPANFTADRDSISIFEFNHAIHVITKEKNVKHYKCRCRKCGKTRYYTKETLINQPTVCYKPVYCSTRFTYSCRAQNANYHKRKKFENDESVCLVDDKNDVIPCDDYCDAWNNKRKKELIKQAEKNAQIIAGIPRRKAVNYDVDYVGSTYESLEVLECVNDALESIPVPHYNQRHQKLYNDITVYKEYRCRCYLCGKEQLVTCDNFGIHPPTDYGYRAYNGYWSVVYCDCHHISSFQWIVNDILLKHNIDYKVEVEADGAYGIDAVTPLRFDFAIYKEKDIIAFIECQGEQHYMPVEEFGGERRFAIQQRNDEQKRNYAISTERCFPASAVSPTTSRRKKLP